jgi:hypothetical protein
MLFLPVRTSVRSRASHGGQKESGDAKLRKVARVEDFLTSRQRERREWLALPHAQHPGQEQEAAKPRSLLPHDTVARPARARN